MDYIDLEGKLAGDTTAYDNILNFLYTSIPGRMLLKLLVQPRLSQTAGRLLDSHFSTCLIRHFIRANRIDMKEYENRHYQSFNDFFTRKLQDGQRSAVGDERTLISPCDGKVSLYPIQKNTIFSVKKTEYTLRSLLRSRRLADRFAGGYAFIFRLSVDDCHRYLYAASGQQSKNYHIDGIFHTVSPIANDYLPVYKENTREYAVIHTEALGDILQMEVGALLVGRITNHRESTAVTRGEEKGFFEYGGSTIILLVQKDILDPRPDLLQNTLNGYETKILQGQALGTATEHKKQSI